MKKTNGTAGIKRFAGCLILTAAFELVPALAAGEPPQRTVAPADAVPPPGTTKERGAAKPRDTAQTGAGTTKAESSQTGTGLPQAAKAGATTPEMAASNAAVADPVSPVLQKVPVARTGMEGDPAGGENNANVRKYCTNIAPAANDARFAWQSKKLQELDVQIKSRIAELDAKEAELKAWLDKRDKIAKEAREALVGIYAKMKPETAATQISALDDGMATAVLAALTPRQASAIFNEITPPERAAKLAELLANPLASPAEKKL